jgi:hypothetical protein
MKNFVDDYFSVDKFKKAYARNVEELGYRSFWPKVEFVVHVGAPLAKRGVGRQRKNMIKGCLKAEVERKQAEMRQRNHGNWFVESSSVQTVMSWVIEKTAPSAPSMVQRKGKF